MSETKHHMLYESLKADILAGKYDAGGSFPSEAQLSRWHSVSRTTIHKTLDQLRNEGLIVSRQGRGTIVSRTRASRRIGLIIPGIVVTDFFQPILCELNRLARAEGYELNFGEVYSQQHEERVHQVRELVAEFIKQRVAGIIYEPLVGEGAYELNSHILSVIDRKRIPVVLLDSDIVPFPERSRYDVVGTHDVKAGASIAKHLMDIGAKKVYFHLCPDGPVTFDNRIFGAQSWLAAHDRTSKTTVLASRTGDVAALRRHLKRHGKPDAFVCMNDATAAVFKQTLEQAGLSVPRDVLLTGFADLSVASLTTPPLTTVRQDREAIAQAAFRRLVARMENPKTPPCDVFLPAPLIVRGSTERKGKR